MNAEDHKKLWNELAVADNMESTYIYSDGDIEFRGSGERDYNKLIAEDIYIKQFLGSTIGKSILEIGCGVGRMTEFMARDFDKVYALDISGEMIKKGQERLKDTSNIDWIEGDGIHLIDTKVDLIFSYTVFQHCSLDIVVSNLIEARKSLLDIGVMKIQVRGRGIRQDKWYSGCWFVPEEIKKLLENIGFEVVDIWHDPNEGRYLWIWAT